MSFLRSTFPSPALLGVVVLAAILARSASAADQGGTIPPVAATVAAPARAEAEAQCKFAALRFERSADVAKARADYEEAIRLDPSCPLPHWQLAQLAQREEQWTEAVGHLQRFVALDRTSEQSIAARLRLDELEALRQQDSTPEGKRARHYTEGLERVRAAVQARDFARAENEAAATIAIDPERHEAYAFRGAVLAKAGRQADALAMLETALAKAPAEKKAVIETARDECRESIESAQAMGKVAKFVAQRGDNFAIPGLDLGLVLVRPGTFTWNLDTGEPGGRQTAKARLSQPYWMGKTEVTRGQWTRLMGTTMPQLFEQAGVVDPTAGEGTDHPMRFVTHEEALAFCRKLTERERAAGRLPEGYEYTLPTEAQWEYACRAGTRGDFSGDLDSLGWYAANSAGTMHPVAQKQANDWGLYDMHGSVWEWCLDWHIVSPGPVVTDPIGRCNGSRRIARGGSLCEPASSCSSSSRSGIKPDYRSTSLGFRIALAPRIDR